jgi:hypothetical protein
LSWYNPWSWGLWDSIANQVYPQPNTPASTPASANAANSLVDPDDAALDRALANGATPGSLYPGAGQQTVDALSQAGKDALSDAAQLAMMAGFPEGEGLEAAEEAAAAAKAARAAKCKNALLNPKPIGSALKADKYHNAATFMRDAAAQNGTYFDVVGADGTTRSLVQFPGTLDGQAGRFEYIIDQSGNLTHQMFVPGGTINGIPITP